VISIGGLKVGRFDERDDVSGTDVDPGVLSKRAEAAQPSPSIYEAELAPGMSGAVEYGAEIDETAAVARRRNGKDIVVRGNVTRANRSLTYKIESQVGPPSPPQPPHRITAGPRALPHYHQRSRSPQGHAFYETDKLKARKKP
jgi:hypothetical protein